MFFIRDMLNNRLHLRLLQEMSPHPLLELPHRHQMGPNLHKQGPLLIKMPTLNIGMLQ